METNDMCICKDISSRYVKCKKCVAAVLSIPIKEEPEAEIIIRLGDILEALGEVGSS